MIEEIPLRQPGAIRQCRLGAGAGVVCLSIILMAISGCVTAEPDRKPAARPITPSRQLQTPSESSTQSQAEAQDSAPQLPEDSGQMAWAEGFQGQLIRGLDGELYVPYLPVTIRRVQSVLKERGLYGGPVNGVLDPPTMKSIYAFQEANLYLGRCGVPTPNTRKLLEQGSHTDVAS